MPRPSPLPGQFYHSDMSVLINPARGTGETISALCIIISNFRAIRAFVHWIITKPRAGVASRKIGVSQCNNFNSNKLRVLSPLVYNIYSVAWPTLPVMHRSCSKGCTMIPESGSGLAVLLFQPEVKCRSSASSDRRRRRRPRHFPRKRNAMQCQVTFPLRFSLLGSRALVSSGLAGEWRI